MSITRTLLTTLAAVILSTAQASAQDRWSARSERTDRTGVRWSYGERIDPLNDRREVALVATWRRNLVGLLCVEGLGTKLTFVIPNWFFLGGADQPLEARVDRAEPFSLTVVGDGGAGRRASARPDRAGRELALGVLTAQERIIIRNRDGETLIFPMAGPRPDAERFRARCREIVPPTLPEN